MHLKSFAKRDYSECLVRIVEQHCIIIELSLKIICSNKTLDYGAQMCCLLGFCRFSRKRTNDSTLTRKTKQTNREFKIFFGGNCLMLRKIWEQSEMPHLHVFCLALGFGLESESTNQSELRSCFLIIFDCQYVLAEFLASFSI